MGTHFSSSKLLQHYIYDRKPLENPIPVCLIPVETNPAIEQEFAETIRDWGIRYTLPGKLVRFIYLRIKGTKS